MKNHILYYLIFSLFLTFGLTSCELFGLELQKGYEYDAEKGKYDNQLKISTWEFMNQRADIFSELIAAVEYAGIDPEIFNNPNQTNLLLTNQALTSTTASHMSFWYRNRLDLDGDSIQETMAVSWDVYPKEQIKDFILYHIVKGSWSYYELTDATQGAIHFFPTYSTKANGYMALQMLKEGALSIYFNNFTGHYKEKIKPRTANMKTINGSYIHVMDNYLEYPTDENMALIPI